MDDSYRIQHHRSRQKNLSNVLSNDYTVHVHYVYNTNMRFSVTWSLSPNTCLLSVCPRTHHSQPMSLIIGGLKLLVQWIK